MRSQGSKRGRCHFSTLRADEFSNELQLDHVTTLHLSLPSTLIFSIPRLFSDSSLRPADGASPCQSSDNRNQRFYRPSSVLSIRLNSGQKLKSSPSSVALIPVRRRSSGLCVAAERLQLQISDVGVLLSRHRCCRLLNLEVLITFFDISQMLRVFLHNIPIMHCSLTPTFEHPFRQNVDFEVQFKKNSLGSAQT